MKKNNRVLYEIGFNWGRSPCSNRFINTHAEISALKKYTKKLRNKKIKNRKVNLVVIRVNSENKFMESRPCHHCMESLKKSGININKLYFSTCEGTIECVNFNEWSKLTHNLSSGNKCRKEATFNDRKKNVK